MKGEIRYTHFHHPNSRYGCKTPSLSASLSIDQLERSLHLHCDRERYEEAEQKSGDIRIRRHSGHSLKAAKYEQWLERNGCDDDTYLREWSIVYWEKYRKQKVGIATPTFGKSNCPKPAKEVDRWPKDIPRQFREELRRDQRRPVIHPAMLLSYLIDRAHVNEYNLQLIRKWDW